MYNNLFIYRIKYVISLFLSKSLFLLNNKKDYIGIAPYSINLHTNTQYNLIPFMLYNLTFHDFLIILLYSLQFNSSDTIYIYVFNYKGELITIYTFIPNKIKSWNIKHNLSKDYGLQKDFSDIVDSCRKYILDTNS